MTVIYSTQQSELPLRFNNWSWFRSVLFRWRGSVFKYVFVELLFVTIAWYSLRAYLDTLSSDDRATATHYTEFIRTYQGTMRTLLSFMLVYFYQEIYGRAKNIFWHLPWPDECVFMVNSMVGVHAHDPEANEPCDPSAGDQTTKAARGKLLRATIARYILATCFMVCHSISAKFAHIYGEPYQGLVKLGLLTKHEAAIIEHRKDTALPYLSELHFIPTVWAQYTVRQAFKEGQFLRADQDAHVDAAADQSMLARLQEALKSFRSSNATVLFAGYLPFPTLLCQIVTFLTYAYIGIAVVAQQDSANTENSNAEPSLYFPWFTCIDTIVYVGALRVGQLYVNPLGSDDDNYEVVAFFNRNLRLVQLYGLYGTEDAGGFPNMPMPPMTDLLSVQNQTIPNIPFNFFDEDNSSVGAFGRSQSLVRHTEDGPLLADETDYMPPSPNNPERTSSASLKDLKTSDKTII